LWNGLLNNKWGIAILLIYNMELLVNSPADRMSAGLK
jgi:hypothetical protein